MSRRTTRSQTICLEKAPIYNFSVNAKRKSTTPKKCGEPLTPITNPLLQNKCATNTNGQIPESTKPKNIQATPTFTPPLKKASTATTKKKTPSNHKVNSTANAEQTPAFETIACNTSRRITRSQSVLLTKAPVNIGKRKSEPAKIRDQSTPYKSISKVLSTSLTYSKKVIEVTPETKSVPKRSLATAKVKALPKDRCSSEASSANVLSSAKLDPIRRRHTIESFQYEDIVTTTSNQSQGDEADVSSINDVTKIKPNTVLRRSARTRDTTRKPKEIVSSASRASKRSNVSRRRHTDPVQSTTTDENVDVTQDQGNSTEVRKPNGISSGVQSNEVKKRTNKRSNTLASGSANINGTSTRIQSKENVTLFINITDDLRRILIDDSKFINTSKKLYEIPSDMNIAEVIEEYVTNAGNEESNSWNSSSMTVKGLFQGIIDYCDVLIGKQLLYEPERAQFLLVLNNFPGVAVSKIYPPIYLLRLLVQLNRLLHYKKINDELLKFSVDNLHQFIKYLSDNKSTFFNGSR